MENNIERTVEYYASDMAKPCDCKDCQLFYEKFKHAYPKISQYLLSLGIDCLKPLELSSVPSSDRDGIEYISCQYVVIGSCTTDFSIIIDDVNFCISSTHPSTGLTEEHFVLEFYPIFLKL